jgi:hypothetical protein
MGSTRHLAWFFAAAVCVALLAMPSVALAHGGHVHEARGGVAAKAAAPDAAGSVAAASERDVQSANSFVADPSTALRNSDCGCVGGCCHGMPGMSCCSVALIPDPIEALPARLFAAFTATHSRLGHGLPPEALPKPPKFFA